MKNAMPVFLEVQDNRHDLMSTKVLNSFLQVCSQCGEVERAMSIFNRMKIGPKEYRPSGRTYVTLLHMWSRQGNVAECKRVLSQMRPEEITVNAGIFLPLFEACEASKDVIGLLNAFDLIKKNNIPHIVKMWDLLARVLYYHSTHDTEQAESNALATTTTTPGDTTDTDNTNNANNTEVAIIPFDSLILLVEEMIKEGYAREMAFVMNNWIEAYMGHNDRTRNADFIRESAKLRITLRHRVHEWLHSTSKWRPAPSRFKPKTQQPQQKPQQEQPQQEQQPQRQRAGTAE